MAKIFSNIAKSTNTLSKRYSDSTVNSSFTTFSALRNVDGNLRTTQILNVRRIKDVYDLYLQVPANLNPVVKNYSNLVTPVTLQRTRSTQFYSGFKVINTDLTVTNVPINNTFVEIKPPTNRTQPVDFELYAVDDSKMRQDSQSLPLVSGPRDVYRISQYLTSAEGIRFLAQQSRLQGGNTFGQSRRYATTSVPNMTLNYSVANLNNPLERIPRLAITDAMINPELWGRIQRETVISTQSKLRLKFVGGARRAVPSATAQAATRTLANIARNRIANTTIRVPSIFNRATSWLNNTFNTRFSLGNTVTLGQIGNALNNVAAVGDTLTRGLNIDNATLEQDQTAYDALYARDLWPIMKENDGVVRSHQGEKEAYIARARAALGQIKGQLNNANTFTQQYPQDDYRSSATYTEDVRNPQSSNIQEIDGVTIINARYVRDNLNLDAANNSINNISDLDGLNVREDYIKFGIKVPGVFPNGIFFRAFIEDINHSAKGEYDSVRYVGRPERFVTYKGMSRSLTFSLYLIAFSENELDTIWARCNMLNKLVYPIDNAGGFMTPPLASITLGNIFTDQPGYVENVDMRLQDIPWDIDKELPQAVKLNVSYNILEKSYISQDGTSPLRHVQLFNQVLRPLGTPTQAENRPFLDGTTLGAPITFAQQPQATVITPPPVPSEQRLTFARRVLNPDALGFGLPGVRPDNTRVALPQRTATPSYLSEAQRIFTPSAASVNLQSAFSNLGRASRARPTIGPRP